ncbi:hypothetical protein Leryth_026027 [Lithospermum erythrorhizon]|nr:hypothetical protein Leryth_026027 [Lithospermum erythrorhizon]
MGSEEKDSGLKKLEYLSVVSKVCSELETHLGFGDKVVAEFITELGRDCHNVDAFDEKLKQIGDELPDYFVRTLLTIIHAILPPKSKSEKNTGFSALNIADNKDSVREIELEIKAKRKPEEEEGKYRDYRGRDREGYGYHGRDRGRDRDKEEDGYRGRDKGREKGREEDEYREREAGRDRDDEYNGGNKDRGRDRRDDDGEVGRKDKRNGNSGEPELYQVYKGRVSRVMDTGCFVSFNDFRGKEGLVHVSQMATGRLANAKAVVKRDQEVFVKVRSFSGQKMSLSMTDVDQHTGKDLLPLKRSSEDEDRRVNPSGANSGGPVTRIGLSGIRITEEESAPSRRPLKRLSSPERWEAKQLIAAGVMSLKELPSFDDEGDGLLNLEEDGDEELEIELNEDEPEFLQGQSRYSVDISPVKIFKNPEGSLSRAAALQSALSKERREVRDQRQRQCLILFLRI